MQVRPFRINTPNRFYFISAQDINPSTGKAYAINPASGNWDDNYFSKNYGGASSNNGNTSQQMQDVTDAAKNAQNNFNNLVTSNTKAVTDFLPKYQGDVATAQNEGNTKYNVPEFQNLVTGLSSRVSDLEENTSNSAGGDVGNTGAGGFSNANQVDTAVSSRYLPQLNTAEGNLNTASGLAQTYVNQKIAPDQAYGQLLGTNISTAMSGLGAEQAATLNAILGKLEAGVSLSNTEAQIGENWAATVLDQANKMTLGKLQASYTPIAPGSTLVNPNSGTIINPSMLAANGSYTP